MICISLWQPWASAIPLRLKAIETRGYETKVRGRFAIQASKRWTKGERDFTAARRRAGDPLPDPMPLGVIVATAVLHDVVPTTMLLAAGVSDLERMYGDYAPGRFGWLLRDVVPLENPIEWSGKQGFFHVPDELFPAEARVAPASPQSRLWPFPVSAHTEAAC
jgi:activating signal cointegrator 1